VAFPGRTDATEMAKILDLTTGFDTSLPIDTANELVTEVCATALKADGVTPFHTASRLKLIETYLACHFYCIHDPRSQRERVGPLTFESQSKVDLGLDVTHYGQQAKRLDTSGGLAMLDEAITDGKQPGKFVCSLKWLGRAYSNWPKSPSDIQGE